MRPLVVDLGRDYRGGQHQALLLLKGLLARGHAPELIAVEDSQLALRAWDAGISVHTVFPGRVRLDAALQIRRFVRRRRPGAGSTFTLNASSEAWSPSERVDIVHANEPHALTSAWLARAHRSVPVIASRRIALPLSKSSLSLARYSAAAHIVAVSHFVEKSVIESGLPSDCIEVIYDGVEIPPEISSEDRSHARGQLSISPGGLCIGNVAAFVPEKGHAILLRAFAKLRTQFPGCILLLCGEGPERRRLQELAQELNIFDAVRFAGPVPEISIGLAAMDAFVFPSHEEPLGSALLAAMAYGLPVVAIGRGGIPEIVEDGKNGLLVNSLDPDPLAEAIAVVLANPDAACLLGKVARETVSARFSVDEMVGATLRLYEGAIGDQ